MDIFLFGGFLGSGKTSVILQAAAHITQQFGKGNLVVIENEVGETGIDDKILRGNGLNVRELFSGCICCTLNAELTICLNEIQEKYAPEHVIIEATGMAYPQKIADTLLTYGKGITKLSKVIVADAERWDELTVLFPVLIEGQVRHADFIMLNKIDALQEQDVRRIEDHLRQMNPNAVIFPISAHQGIGADIWQKVVLGCA